MTYKRMIENIQTGVPDAAHRFTPLFGLSQKIVPKWLSGQPRDFTVDFVFLDGGNNPREQLTEFAMLDPWIPIGGQLMSHDAKLRKGKWLVPYLSRLDNWETKLHDASDEGMFCAVKVSAQPSPTSSKAASACLRKLKLDLAEIAAAILPSRVCGMILNLMPESLSRSLRDGRK